MTALPITPSAEEIASIRAATEEGGYVWLHRPLCLGKRHSYNQCCWCDPFLISERDDIREALRRAARLQ